MAFRSIFCLLFISLTGLLSAQPDPLNYYVVLKDSTAFACKIPYQIPNKIIQVIKPDRSEENIVWSKINSIFVIDSSGNKTDIRYLSKSDLKALRKTETTKAEHSKWDSCFIVKQTGDTVYGKIKARTDYSSTGAYTIFSEDFWTSSSIKFLHPGEREELFSLAQIKELFLKNRSPGYQKYLCIDSSLYRVITDGNCKLVYNEEKGTSSGAMMMNAAGGGFTPIGAGAAYDVQRYFIYYNDELTKMKTASVGSDNLIPIVFDGSAMFKAKCRRIFSECPALLAEIENRTLRSNDLRQIVDRFNTCILQK
ncbi:MAG: hypothetical protein V4615_11580 [Bacteroidota bacterium]